LLSRVFSEDLPEELETCKDKRQDCATLFINGQCEHELVKQVCQRSCSTCPSAPPLQGVIDPGKWRKLFICARCNLFGFFSFRYLDKEQCILSFTNGSLPKASGGTLHGKGHTS